MNRVIWSYGQVGLEFLSPPFFDSNLSPMYGHFGLSFVVLRPLGVVAFDG